MFTERKSQSHKYQLFIQLNLEIQCIPIKISASYFCEYWFTYPILFLSYFVHLSYFVQKDKSPKCPSKLECFFETDESAEAGPAQSAITNYSHHGWKMLVYGTHSTGNLHSHKIHTVFMTALLMIHSNQNFLPKPQTMAHIENRTSSAPTKHMNPHGKRRDVESVICILLMKETNLDRHHSVGFQPHDIPTTAPCGQTVKSGIAGVGREREKDNWASPGLWKCSTQGLDTIAHLARHITSMPEGSPGVNCRLRSTM